MKYSKRTGVFETNSSSVHTLVICTEDDFDDFKNGKKAYTWKDDLVDAVEIDENEVEKKAEEIYNSVRKSFWKDWNGLDISDKKDYLKEAREYFNDGDYKTYKEFFDYSDFETFERHFVSPSGDRMVAFGNYGYDG